MAAYICVRPTTVRALLCVSVILYRHFYCRVRTKSVLASRRGCVWVEVSANS